MIRTNDLPVAEAIVALERSAIERWNRGDVDGCLEIYADDVSYFDPVTEKRLDGRQAVERYFRAVYEGNIDIARFEFVEPQVIVGGDMAVLTYNLANFMKDSDGAEKAGSQWNSTQVYRRLGADWRVVHVHWGFTRHPGVLQELAV
jgi:uncharacterized protein (TIGR02246 family)